MARGESAKDRPQGPALAIGAVFGALCLASLTLVATCTDIGGCSGAASVFAPVRPAEPFAGAADAIGELGWRDAARARPTYAAPPAPDATAARAALATTLRGRGYVEAEPADDARAQDLSFTTIAEGLDGACGVVAVLGVGTATLHSIEGPEGLVLASDPSVVTIAACGAVTVRAFGTGRATIAVWQLPGITPADVAATGVPADVLLAHAEAEALWRARGWEPAGELVREVRGSSPPRLSQHDLPPPMPAPTSGCVAWVGVVTGAGLAETILPAPAHMVIGRDYATDRGLFGAVSCAGMRSSTHVTDPSSDGYVVYWRAWGSAVGGPSRPAAPGTLPLSTTGLPVVERSATALPSPFPATAP